MKAASERGVTLTLVEATPEQLEKGEVLIRAPKRVDTALIALALPMVMALDYLRAESRGQAVDESNPTSDEQAQADADTIARWRAAAPTIAAAANDDFQMEHRYVRAAVHGAIRVVRRELAERRRRQREQEAAQS